MSASIWSANILSAMRCQRHPLVGFVADEGGQRLNLAHSLGGDNPELGKMSAQGVDGLRSLPNQEASGLERHLTGLALNRFNGNEAHSRAEHRFAYGLGIDRICFAALDIGLHIGRRNQSGIMTETSDLARPEVRTTAGFKPNTAGRQLAEKFGAPRTDEAAV